MRETLYSQKLYKAIRKLNMDKEETGQLLNCLYINGCSSEDCARLFGTTEEQVIKFLESEKLYGYQVCIKCGRLKDKIIDFRQYKDRKIMTCKDCETKHNQQYWKIHVDDRKEYREKNKDREKEYRKNNKKRLLKKQKAYRKKNKEKIKEKRKAYDKKNKERIKEKKRKYEEKNKEYILEKHKQYSQQETSVEKVQRLAKYETVSGNQIRCKYCGKWMTPTNLQVQCRLQGIEVNDRCYIYCSEECKQECPTYGQKKYPKGFKVASSREVNPVLRQIVLKRDNYTCQMCGKFENVRLHCHHKIPAVNSPIEADDPDNCITLCKECHHEVHKIPGCGYGELRCA